MIFRYLAAKTCYFGVGGGTNAFTSLVTSDKYNFGINTVKLIKNGNIMLPVNILYSVCLFVHVGVQREILRICRLNES